MSLRAARLIGEDHRDALAPTLSLELMVAGPETAGKAALVAYLRQSLAASQPSVHVLAAPEGDAAVASALAAVDIVVFALDARKADGYAIHHGLTVASLFDIRAIFCVVNGAPAASDSFLRVEAYVHEIAGEAGASVIGCFPGLAAGSQDASVFAKVRDAVAAALPGLDAAGRPLRVCLEETAPGTALGRVGSGTISTGDRLIVMPGGSAVTVEALRCGGKAVASASAGSAVELSFAEPATLMAGEILAAEGAAPDVSDQFAAYVFGAGSRDLLPSRDYVFQVGTRAVLGQITALRFALDPESQAHSAATRLTPGMIGKCHLKLQEAVAYDPHAENPATGAFSIRDRETGTHLAHGTILFALRRAANIRWQALDIDKTARAALKTQKPCLLWFTGLSGSGKSTIANLLEKRLHAMGRHTYLLDADNVRHGLNKDLGFTEEDRVENIRRVAEVGKLMVDAGLIVVASFISPFRSERQMARELLDAGEFIEVFVDTSLEECEKRDPKGLYKKARAGKIPNFTGIDSPYEPPVSPELSIDTAKLSATGAVDMLMDFLERGGHLDAVAPATVEVSG